MFASVELFVHRKEAIPRSLTVAGDSALVPGGRLHIVDTVPDGRCLWHALAIGFMSLEDVYKWAAVPKRPMYPMDIDGRTDDVRYEAALSLAKGIATKALAKLPPGCPAAIRAQDGHTPEEEDLNPIAVALGVEFFVFHTSGVGQIVNKGGAKRVHLYRSDLFREDGMPVSHWSFALMANHKTSAPHPALVSHAISVTDVRLAHLMLTGNKTLENRPCQLSPGWFYEAENW